MGKDCEAVLREIALRFKSGNDVPVERAHITRAEFAALTRPGGEGAGGVDNAMVERARTAFRSVKRYHTGDFPEGSIRSIADMNRNDDDAWKAALGTLQAGSAPGDLDGTIARLQHYVDHIGDMQDGLAGGDPKAVKDALDTLLAIRAGSAPGEAQREELDSRYWEVEVRVSGESVLTIGHNHLSGIPNIDDFTDTVRKCGEHLLSFIGSSSAAAASGAGAEFVGWLETQVCEARNRWAEQFEERWLHDDDVPDCDHFIALWIAERIATRPAAMSAAAGEGDAKYHELLYAVESKWPGETRHETALRYIREREHAALSSAAQEGK